MPARKKLTDTLAPLEAGTTLKLPIADLRSYKKNPRKGNVGVIAASLRAHGQYRPITVNIGTHTGRTLEVLAGNHTLKAHRDLAERFPTEGWEQIEVHLVDVDDEQAAKIVLADNATAAKGGYDNKLLAGLLDDVKDDFTGLGYTQTDLDDLRKFDDPVLPDDAYREEDPDEDPEPEGRRGETTVAYALVFETIEQKREWLAFLHWLKGQHPDLTLPGRIIAYIEDLASTASEESDDD